MRVPEKLIWPAVGIDPEVVDPTQIAIGQSRFGGLPDVPPAFEWPRWQGRPLGFLAQINLADIAGFACSVSLPRAGWILFFYDSEQPWGFDPADRGCSHIEYVDADRNLIRHALPSDMPDNARFNVARLSFEQMRTEPDPWSIWIDELQPSADDRFELAEDQDNRQNDSSALSHQIGGHPSPIQGAMETECQLVTNGISCGNDEGYRSEQASALAPGAFAWRCVLQLDSDDDIGWMWGDAGSLYFWMQEGDIAESRFDRAWVILQCY